MQTVDRYILSIFGKNLAIVLLALLSLYGLIEFIEKVDDFIEYQASFSYYLLYPLYHLPTMFANSLPMAVLLATFATIGGLSRTGQLTAMLGGGLSFNRVSKPLFWGGAMLTGVIFLTNLWLTPWSTREAEYLLRSEIKGKAVQTESSENIFFRDGNRIISIAHAFPERGQLLDLTIVEFDEEFRPVKRTWAEMVVHRGDGVWQMANVTTWTFSPETKSLTAHEKIEQTQVRLGRKPQEMLQLWNDPEEMSFNDLLVIAEKHSREGHDPRPYQMEAHLRIAKAAIPLIMVLIGIPFALQRGRNASFSRGVIISLGIFLVYFLLYALFSAFGAAAVLPPVVAAWAANLLMLLFGGWLFLRVQG
ncbi:MAG: LPS export ABC transporter permease LptG [Desulfuromonadales bacterium]|nr:LPS export ABC transporter permease LptG [Desulfuromonadales bacterium]